MTNYTDKDGHWITLSDGRHIFVHDGETIDSAIKNASTKGSEEDRKEKQIEYNQKEANELNAERKKQYDTPIGPGNHLGKVTKGNFDAMPTKEEFNNVDDNVKTSFGNFKVVEKDGRYWVNAPGLSKTSFSSQKDAIKGIWLKHFYDGNLNDDKIDFKIANTASQYARKFGMTPKDALQDCFDFGVFYYGRKMKYIDFKEAHKMLDTFGALPKGSEIDPEDDRMTRWQYMIASSDLERHKKNIEEEQRKKWQS